MTREGESVFAAGPSKQLCYVNTLSLTDITICVK